MVGLLTSVVSVVVAAIVVAKPASRGSDSQEVPPDDLRGASSGERSPDPIDPTSAKPKPVRARLRGRVLQYGARTSISGAKVMLADADAMALTDDDGRFSLDLSPGTHELVIRAPGYDDLRTEVTVGENQELTFEYRLARSLTGTTYRTVVRQRREVALSATRLRDAEIREVPGTGGDPLRVVASLPGVAPLAGFLPYVVVRGAAPGNTGYYLDGARIPLLFHVALGPSVIHPALIDAVDFYPGGAPVRLGRFVSGIIEGRTRPGRRDRVHGDIEARVTDASALLEIPLNRAYLRGCKARRRLRCKRGVGRGSLTLAGRYSYTAPILALARADARIRYWDYQARFEHSVGETGEVSVFAFGSFDEVGRRPFRRGGKLVVPDPWARFLFHRLDTRVRQRLRRGGSASYALVLGLDQGGVAQYRTNEWRVAPRVDIRLPVGKRTTLGMGIDQEFQVFRLANTDQNTEDINAEDIGLLFNDRFVSVTGAYLDAQILRGIVEFRPGIRIDVYNQLGSSPYVLNATAYTHAIGADPRISLRERVGLRWVLRQAVGLYHQPPSFPLPVPGIESFGFERGLQQNIQASAGYEVELIRGHLTLTQEAYAGRLRNLQDYEFASASSGAAVNELEDVLASVNGWAYGLETILRLNPEARMFGWAAYTLSRSTREYMVGGSAPSNWDQRHIVNVVLGYRVSNKWSFGGRVHYHTGRPWTAPIVGQSTLDALASNRNNARLPAFFQLDLRVERNWMFPNWQLSIFLDIANATYSREIFQCTPDEDLGTSAMAMGANPARGVAACSPQGFRYVVPTLGLRSRF